MVIRMAAVTIVVVGGGGGGDTDSMMRCGARKCRLRIAPRRKQLVMKVGGATRAIILLQVGHRIIDVFGSATRSSSFRPLIQYDYSRAGVLIITDKRRQG